MRILITFDGSDLSERALASIAPWVRTWKADVLLLSVLDAEATHATLSGEERRYAPPAGLDVGPSLRLPGKLAPHALAEDRGQALEASRIGATEILEARAHAYFPDSAVDVRVEFAENAAEAIACFAEENAVDFIAMSTHGRSGLGHALFGSVMSDVVHRAKVPVIVVGEAAPAELLTA